MQRRQHVTTVVGLFLGVLLMLGLPLVAVGIGPGLTDTDTHAPLASGPYAYDTFKPANANFLQNGQTFVDPVFGATIRRLSSNYPGTGSGIIYSRNDLWNADGTRYLLNPSTGGVNIVDTMTGAVVHAAIPYPYTTTDQTGFDPVTPNLYYYTQTNGGTLSQFDLTTGQTSVVKTFTGQKFTGLGQSANWIDNTGRYMLLAFLFSVEDPAINWDDLYVARIFDKQAGTLFDGGILFQKGISGKNINTGIPPGWGALSPDGKYIILTFNPEHWSFVVDTANHRINNGQTTMYNAGNGTMFWDGCYDHGAIMTASDGKTYLITNGCRFDNTATDSVYRVDVSLNQRQKGAAQLGAPNVLVFTRQKAPNNRGTDGHYSCAARGINRDWCFLNTRYADDTFDNPGTWVAYKQEIIAVNARTLEVRRLAHHRSRNDKYCSRPRTNANWDGTRIAFVSNFGSPGEQTCGYGDHYILEVGPLSDEVIAPTPEPPPVPTPTTLLLDSGGVACEDGVY